jgi:cell division protein FtsI/penicillin-binding protein 2
VRKIVDPLGHVIDDRTAKFERHQALSEETARVMTEQVLVSVVEKGTGKSAQLAEWQVLGKTGTAQIARKGGGGYEPNAYVSVFMSAAPAHDPALVTLVMVRRPDRRIAYYGSQVAAPVAKEILRISLPYLGVKPDPPELRPKLALAGGTERAHD